MALRLDGQTSTAAVACPNDERLAPRSQTRASRECLDWLMGKCLFLKSDAMVKMTLAEQVATQQEAPPLNLKHSISALYSKAAISYHAHACHGTSVSDIRAPWPRPDFKMTCRETEKAPN